MNNAAIYCRDATMEQAEDKKQSLINYAAKNNFKVQTVIIEQRSGTQSVSEKLRQLLLNSDIQTVIVPSISGITRNIKTLFEVNRIADNSHKTIISTDGSYEAIRRNR